MIHVHYSDHIQALRYGAIEAYLTLNDKVNAKDLTDIFGMHRCNAAKIINKYIVDENLGVTYASSAKHYTTLPDYKNVVLLEDTNAVMYLKMLYTLHGKNYAHD